MFQVFTHLGIMSFRTPEEASDFFWTMLHDIEASANGWAGWDEFFVNPAGLVCTSKLVEDMRHV